MPRRLPDRPIHLRAARLLDVVKGELIEPGDLLIEGERIAEAGRHPVRHHRGERAEAIGVADRRRRQ